MYAELPEFIGEYRITGLLGEGAVARVFSGTEPDTGRSVAIKILREGHSPEHRTVERFIAEVDAVKQIRHRNIIDIFAFGTLPDGRPYFVMEHQPGMTLQQRLDREGPLTFLEAAPIFAQACEALSAAHEHGIIHRDLKPDNIYLADEAGGPPLVKLLDFGIAKLVTQQSSAALTQVGSTVGTPLYMSPEQIRALPLDARSDIYTLGVSLFQTLTGEFPFYAESHAQTATMHLTQAPPLPSQVSDLWPIPEQAEAIVMRCLEKAPAARFASVAELKDALDAAMRELMTARKLSGSPAKPRVSLPSVPPLPPALSGPSVPAHSGPAQVSPPLSAQAVLHGAQKPRFTQPARTPVPSRPITPARSASGPAESARRPAKGPLSDPNLRPAKGPLSDPGQRSAEQPGQRSAEQPGQPPGQRPSSPASQPGEGQRRNRQRPAQDRTPTGLSAGSTAGKIIRYVAWYLLMIALGVVLWLVLSRIFHWPLR